MTSPYTDNIDAYLTSFVDYSEAAPEIGALAFDDGALGAASSASSASFYDPSPLLQRVKSDILPSNVEAPLNPNDMFGALTTSMNTSSSSASSTSSAISQPARQNQQPGLRRQRKQHFHPSGTNDSDSDLCETDDKHMAFSTPQGTSFAQTLCMSETPPATPQALSCSLPNSQSTPMTISMNTSPSQESIQRLRQLRLSTNLSPVRHAPSMTFDQVKSASSAWSESMSALHTHAARPVVSMPSCLMATPHSHTQAPHHAASQQVDPCMIHPYSHASLQNLALKNLMHSNSMSTLHHSSHQQPQPPTYINPASTQTAISSPGCSKQPSNDSSILWAPISLTGNSTSYEHQQHHHAMHMTQSPPPIHPQLSPAAHAPAGAHAKPIQSPSGRRRGSFQRIPRKAQSTPHFSALEGDTSRTASIPSSPCKARSSVKTLRKLQSNRRLNGQGNTASEPSKPQTGRLRMRGSMAALREANAMHATKQSPAQRRPLTLSFVNYGIEDAEELCSAVAPSGSYKVPLRGFKDSSDDEGEQNNSSPHAPPSEPVTPHSRNSPSALTPDPISLPMSLQSADHTHIKIESGLHG